MLWLWYKGNHVQIYDVSYDKNGYPLFLIYEDGQWKRVSAKHFKPTADGGTETTC